MDSNFVSPSEPCRLPPVDRLDSRRSPMRTPVHARLGSGLYPNPAGCRALLAHPPLSPEDAGRRCNFEVAFGARHSSSARVARDLHNVRCAPIVLAIRPRTRQLTMFVTMLGARVHFTNATSVRVPTLQVLMTTLSSFAVHFICFTQKRTAFVIHPSALVPAPTPNP